MEIVIWQTLLWAKWHGARGGVDLSRQTERYVCLVVVVVHLIAGTLPALLGHLRIDPQAFTGSYANTTVHGARLVSQLWTLGQVPMVCPLARTRKLSHLEWIFRTIMRYRGHWSPRPTAKGFGRGMG